MAHLMSLAVKRAHHFADKVLLSSEEVFPKVIRKKHFQVKVEYQAVSIPSLRYCHDSYIGSIKILYASLMLRKYFQIRQSRVDLAIIR